MSFQFTVQTNGLRLDAFLASQLENSRSFIQEQIKAGQVSINGAVQTKPGLRLKSGDNVEGSLSHTEPLLLSPIKGPLDILHEDDDILVINKSQGLVVHPAPGLEDPTLVHFLLHYMQQDPNFVASSEDRPGIVHRLDRGTSGVILVAKHRIALEKLSAQFKNREVRKEYWAVVWGRPPLQGKVETAIGRDLRNRKKISSQSNHPKPALTHWKTQKRPCLL